MNTVGHVTLVGAGPGDPGLLTRKAAAALRRADLVLYDALVDERVVALARRAQRFFVGKRAGRHALSQQEIQTLLVNQALRGRRVVRLKGGDPFVFGRGGEEAQALERAGVPYSVIPGVSSAIAAPASAGIPVTHREHAGAVLIISGHDVALFSSTVGALRPNGVTLVILMGVGRRQELAGQLIAAGWDPQLPAAIVADGTLPSEQVWRGELRELQASAAVQPDGEGPAVIVVGTVAALSLTGQVRAQVAAAVDTASAEDAGRRVGRRSRS